MSYIQIGWPATPLQCQLSKGNSGTLRIAPTVMMPDGVTPLPDEDYTGWNATLSVARAGLAGVEGDSLEITTACQPDLTGHRLVCDFAFTTARTENLSKGFYVGAMVMTDPDGEKHKPCSVNINVTE